MNKKLIMIAMFGILLISFMSFIPAQNKSILVKETNPTALETFFNNLNFKYKILKPFSVVGDDRDCGDEEQKPHKTIYLDEGDSKEVDVDDYCAGYGLIDVFRDWDPVAEFEESIEVVCWDEGSLDECQIEIYCCPYDEPNDDEDCQDEGFPPGSYKKVDCDDEDGEYDMRSGHPETLYWCPGESNIPYEDNDYSYCQCTDEKTCWYHDGNDCGNTRTYCDISDCEDLTYQGNQLYNSKSDCQNAQGCNSPSGDIGQYRCHAGYIYKCESGDWSYTGICGADDCSDKASQCESENIVKDNKCSVCSAETHDDPCSATGDHPSAKHGKFHCVDKNIYQCSDGSWINYKSCSDYGSDYKCAYNSDYITEKIGELCETCITESELLNYATQWKQGSISRNKLGNKIVEWVEC